MKKRNQKGYMLVEIIVSFSIAFVILISLVNLVLKFKDTNEDLFYETKYLRDKSLITRNIMDDLKKCVVSSVEVKEDGTIVDFWRIPESNHLNGNTNHEKRRLEINGNTIKYGKIEEDSFVIGDESYYKKTLESTLNIGTLEINNNYGVFSLKIPMTSIYTDKTYDIKISSKRVYLLDTTIYVQNKTGEEQIEYGDATYGKFNHGYPQNPTNPKQTPEIPEIVLFLNINGKNLDEVADKYITLDYKSKIQLTKVESDAVDKNIKTNNFNNIYDFSSNVHEIDKDTILNLYFDENLELREVNYSFVDNNDVKNLEYS